LPNGTRLGTVKQPGLHHFHLKAASGGKEMLKTPILLTLAALLLCSAATLRLFGQSDTETILRRLNGGVVGELPSGLVFDKEGNLYGTTEQGGNGPCTFPVQGCGTVFELEPIKDSSGDLIGGWTMKVLYTFQGGADGASPLPALVFDKKGNLYGTTVYGGSVNCPPACGTVFELHRRGGRWVEEVLYRFSGGSDGATPEGVLALDDDGNIFGTTYNGGLNVCGGWPCGVVFELQRTASGWTESILHSFDYRDGGQPLGGLAIDSAGNLYGTTPYGGQPNTPPFDPTGTIFELQRTGSGWSFKVLYRFPSDAGGPYAGLTFDGEGNLYGTTVGGGAYGYGSVFELRRPVQEGTRWAFSNLYSFMLSYDGGFPTASVIFDGAGNLYGITTQGGGGHACQIWCGVVFQLTPSGGSWTESVLYNFQGGTDGEYPDSAPVLDQRGNLYGATPFGGDPNCTAVDGYSGCGTVYRINRDVLSPES
jgi:hypothetical protein